MLKVYQNLISRSQFHCDFFYLILIKSVKHLLLIFVRARVDDALVIAEKGTANLAEVGEVEQPVAETTSGIWHTCEIHPQRSRRGREARSRDGLTRPGQRRRSRRPCPRTARLVLRFAAPSSTGTAAQSPGQRRICLFGSSVANPRHLFTFTGMSLVTLCFYFITSCAQRTAHNVQCAHVSGKV